MGCSASSTGQQPQVAVKGTRTREVDRAKLTFHDTYILGAKLGRGAFAQVRLATRVRRSEMIADAKDSQEAVKIIDVRDRPALGEPGKAKQQMAIREATLWRVVGTHANVINLLDFFISESLCYFVMERCACSLLTALQKENDLNEQTLGWFFNQMATGLAHVHSAGLVHRDIKPDNFLMSGDGTHVKLGDFGLSMAMPMSGVVKGIYGTAPFMCPEMLEMRPYDKKADVWSLAVIVYVLLFGRFPYTPSERGSNSMKQAILKNDPKPRFQATGRASKTKYSSNALSLIHAMMVRDPIRRPTSDQVLQMPFMLEGSRYTFKPWSEDLPSLRPMLHSAKKVGAFENRDICKFDSTDQLLAELQTKHHNIHLPSADKEHMPFGEEEVADRLKSHLDKPLVLKTVASDVDNSDTCSTRSSLGDPSKHFETPRTSKSTLETQTPRSSFSFSTTSIASKGSDTLHLPELSGGDQLVVSV